MNKSRLEMIFDVEDEIRRAERELKVRRWEHAHLVRLLEQSPQQHQKYRSLLLRLWYRLKALLRRPVLVHR